MPEEAFGHETFLSPFTWRYGSKEMKAIFSEKQGRLNWRKIWVALAKVQHEAGLVSKEELDDIAAHEKDVDLERSHKIEAEIGHDVMAEVKVFAEQAKIGGGKIHFGATSMDPEDNSDMLRMKQALSLLKNRLSELLEAFKKRMDDHAGTIAMGYTHMQPAEPTTFGYRLANYAQDLLIDFEELKSLEKLVKGKGIKGAVGTSASYARLLKGKGMTPRKLEEKVMQEIGLEALPVSTQTYARKMDLLVLQRLAGIAQSLHRFALDLRVLQSPGFGEASEPFGKKQVGSSAMPFKKNPIRSEGVNSLAAYVSSLPQVAWYNAAQGILERTMHDSANRRVIIPEAFLAVDEMLMRVKNIVAGMQVNEESIQRQLEKYGPFAASESLLMELTKAGASRQDAHELIREHALDAWSDVQAGKPNSLAQRLADDSRVTRFVPRERVLEIVSVEHAKEHVGDAVERTHKFSKLLENELKKTS